jgi:hypothetical protein
MVGRRKPMPSKNAACGCSRTEHQLADRLLGAVAGQRRGEELVADGLSGNGAPNTAMDAGEDDAAGL